MKNILWAFLGLFIFVNYTLNAMESGEISGTVKDVENGTPVEADIRLFTGDTVFVKGLNAIRRDILILEIFHSGHTKLKSA